MSGMFIRHEAGSAVVLFESEDNVVWAMPIGYLQHLLSYPAGLPSSFMPDDVKKRVNEFAAAPGYFFPQRYTICQNVDTASVLIEHTYTGPICIAEMGQFGFSLLPILQRKFGDNGETEWRRQLAYTFISVGSVLMFLAGGENDDQYLLMHRRHIMQKPPALVRTYTELPVFFRHSWGGGDSGVHSAGDSDDEEKPGPPRFSLDRARQTAEVAMDSTTGVMRQFEDRLLKRGASSGRAELAGGWDSCDPPPGFCPLTLA